MIAHINCHCTPEKPESLLQIDQRRQMVDENRLRFAGIERTSSE